MVVRLLASHYDHAELDYLYTLLAWAKNSCMVVGVEHDIDELEIADAISKLEERIEEILANPLTGSPFSEFLGKLYYDEDSGSWVENIQGL